MYKVISFRGFWQLWIKKKCPRWDGKNRNRCGRYWVDINATITAVQASWLSCNVRTNRWILSTSVATRRTWGIKRLTSIDDLLMPYIIWPYLLSFLQLSSFIPFLFISNSNSPSLPPRSSILVSIVTWHHRGGFTTFVFCFMFNVPTIFEVVYYYS